MLVPGRCSNNLQNVNFKPLVIDIMSISWEIDLMWLQLKPADDVNVGSGNGSVPPGSKLLSGPVLGKICVAIWRH